MSNPHSGTGVQPGIIFLTMQELFDRINEVQEETITEVTLSYLEIYNETIRDLLVPGGTKQGLMLREDVNQAVSVAGLSSHHPRNVMQVMDMLVEGNAARTQSPTEANATSSRSHAVLQINVSRKDRNAAISEPTTMATLSIIDLAGSERASATKNRGERLLEGANINKSLLALGSCINALCDPRKKNHVPYRNSKLTRLLKFSLGGNCKTVMIVCVSPSSVHFDETQNTLRYANRAKNIQTKVVRNVFNVDRHVKDYLMKIDEQRAMINELKKQSKDHEALAMTKFKKLEEKRAVVAKEGIARIRTAHQNSSQERADRTACLKRLRQIERRIAMISAWVQGFDRTCETRQGEEPHQSLTTLRKTAQGILAELESSRQHQHQQIAKSTWERALDSALQTGLRQLQETSPGNDSAEVASLKRECELLKSNADREAHVAVLEQERAIGEAALMQIVLQGHFEAIAILGQMMQMDEQEAMQVGRDMLGKLFTSSTEVTAQVIRPDGGLQILEAVPPSRMGTPRRRKPVVLMGPSPVKNKIRPSLLNAAHLQQAMSPGDKSPVESSPGSKRRLGVRKSLAFARASPRKRSPVKLAKRGVRWRDDTADGQLADFQATPVAIDSTPETSLLERPVPALTLVVPEQDENADASQLEEVDENDERDEHDETLKGAVDSPIMPYLASLSLTDKTKASRFSSGFLTKRSDNATSTPVSNEEDTHRPLQEITGNIAPSQPSATDDKHDDEDAGRSESDDANMPWHENKDSARRISSAMRLKRTSSSGHDPSQVRREAARRDVRRKNSPTTARTTSPTSTEQGLFSTSQARRMVKGDRGGESNVLSPRSAPVIKAATVSSNARRTSTLGGDMGRDGGLLRHGSVRTSLAGRPGAPTKSAWR